MKKIFCCSLVVLLLGLISYNVYCLNSESVDKNNEIKETIEKIKLDEGTSNDEVVNESESKEVNEKTEDNIVTVGIVEKNEMKGENVEENESENIEENEIKILDEKEENDSISDDVVENIEDVVATSSNVNIKIYWLNSITPAKDDTVGKYSYSWDTYKVLKDTEFDLPDNIKTNVKVKDSEQEYMLNGFSDENQNKLNWKYANYHLGEKVFETSFTASEDMEIWATYIPKNAYVSALLFGEKCIYYITTFDSKEAIKDIKIEKIKDFKDRFIKNNKVKKDYVCKTSKYTRIYYTTLEKYGKPILVSDLPKYDENVEFIEHKLYRK